MNEPETTAVVLKGAGDIERTAALALDALKAGHRVVVTASFNGERSHVFTAVRNGIAFQVISVKGRSRHDTENKAISAGMSVVVDFLTYKGPS